MKKLVGLLIGFLMVFAVSGSAGAYSFTDTIDYWNLSGTSYGETQETSHWWDSVSLTENDPLSYTHIITDDVNFSAGHFVTSADLELDFTNDQYDWVFTNWYDSWLADTTEHIYYAFDGGSWVYLDEVDDGQYTVGIDLSLLNDDGQLAVQLSVTNWDNGNTDAWLDHSKLSGTAVPEPTTMLLLGLGLLGFAGVSRKRNS